MNYMKYFLSWNLVLSLIVQSPLALISSAQARSVAPVATDTEQRQPADSQALNQSLFDLGHLGAEFVGIKNEYIRLFPAISNNSGDAAALAAAVDVSQAIESAMRAMLQTNKHLQSVTTDVASNMGFCATVGDTALAIDVEPKLTDFSWRLKQAMGAIGLDMFTLSLFAQWMKNPNQGPALRRMICAVRAVHYTDAALATARNESTYLGNVRENQEVGALIGLAVLVVGIAAFSRGRAEPGLARNWSTRLKAFGEKVRTRLKRGGTSNTNVTEPTQSPGAAVVASTPPPPAPAPGPATGATAASAPPAGQGNAGSFTDDELKAIQEELDALAFKLDDVKAPPAGSTSVVATAPPPAPTIANGGGAASGVAPAAATGGAIANAAPEVAQSVGRFARLRSALTGGSIVDKVAIVLLGHNRGAQFVRATVLGLLATGVGVAGVSGLTLMLNERNVGLDLLTDEIHLNRAGVILFQCRVAQFVANLKTRQGGREYTSTIGTSTVSERLKSDIGTFAFLVDEYISLRQSDVLLNTTSASMVPGRQPLSGTRPGEIVYKIKSEGAQANLEMSVSLRDQVISVTENCPLAIQTASNPSGWIKVDAANNIESLRAHLPSYIRALVEIKTFISASVFGSLYVAIRENFKSTIVELNQALGEASLNLRGLAAEAMNEKKQLVAQQLVGSLNDAAFVAKYRPLLSSMVPVDDQSSNKPNLLTLFALMGSDNLKTQFELQVLEVAKGDPSDYKTQFATLVASLIDDSR
jgi:hypothetical protein